MPTRSTPRARRQPPEPWESSAAALLVSNNEVVLQRLDRIEVTLQELGKAVVSVARVEERLNGHQAELSRIATLVDGMMTRVDDLEKHRDGTVAVRTNKVERYGMWIGMASLLAGILLVGVEYWNGQQETIKRLQERPSVVLEAQPSSVEHVSPSLQPHIVSPPAYRPEAPVIQLPIKPAVNNPDR